MISAIFALCTMDASIVHAEMAVSHGTGSAPYTGHDSKGAIFMIPTDEQVAIKNAEENAIDIYMAKGTRAMGKNYKKVRNSIMANLPQYILQYDILNEQKTDTSVTLILKTTINASNIDDALQDSSATSTIDQSQRSYILSVFVARQVGSIQKFDDRVYKRSDSEGKVNGHHNESDFSTGKTSSTGAQGEAISGSRIAVNESKASKMNRSEKIKLDADVNTSSVTETGGSTTRKSDRATWRLYDSANLNSSISSVLSDQGYQIVDESDAETNQSGVGIMSEIQKDYATGNDLKPKTMNHIKSAAKAMGIRYVILGTLDMGQPGIDPASTNPRIDVTVNAKVYDLSGPFSRQVVVVGPMNYAGTGDNDMNAQDHALKNAADATAKEMASRMQEKNLY